MNLIEGTDLRKTYRLSRRTSIDALRGVDRHSRGDYRQSRLHGPDDILTG